MSTTPPDSDGKEGASNDDDRTRMLGGIDRRTVVQPATPTQPNAGPAIDNIVALPVGVRLFEFEITRLIGEGGFGIVYAAHDHSLDREVAIKEYMPSSLASRTESHTVSVRAERYTDTFHAGLKSFVNEAKLLARFDHPSLVKVFRFWEMNGTAYMAMPIYKGITLKERLKQMGKPPSEAWLRSLLAPLTEALAVIHAESCFHRDIAPDNILLIEDERPVLLDFGAARRVIGDMTHDLTVILKPGYAPVEQYAEVKSMKQGPWTDIYALAAVMYYAVAGRPPEPSVGRLMGDQMKPLRELGEGRYSEAFLAAIDTALKVHPDERPRDVEAFRALLNQSGSNVVEPASADANAVPDRKADKEPAPAATQRQSSRWGVRASLALTVLALIGVGAFVVYHFEGSHLTPQPSTNTVALAPSEKTSTLPTPPSQPNVPVTTPLASDQTPRAEEKSTPPAPQPTPSESVEQTRTAPETPKADSTEKAANVAKALPPEELSGPIAEPPPRRIMRQNMLEPKAARESQAMDRTPPELSEKREEIRELLRKAQESLIRNEYKLAMQYADNVLAKEPGNLRARRIKIRAQQSEKAAFESIKID